MNPNSTDTSSQLFLCSVHELWRVIDNERRVKEKERIETVKLYFNDFVDALPEANMKDSIFLSIPLLSNAVRSYFDSIYRYKIYSKTPFADKHKQAAYIFKWIAKFKPVQIKSGVTVQPTLSWINSYFAAHCAFSCLFPDQKYVDILCRANFDLYDNLVYAAQYRNLSGRALAALLCSIEMICNAQIELEKKASEQAQTDVVLSRLSQRITILEQNVVKLQSTDKPEQSVPSGDSDE